MTDITTQHSEFKLAKSVSLLIILQLAVGLILGAVIYVFSDLIHILPASISESRSLGLVGTICGGMLFGSWMEKRNPGLLDKEKIKKVAMWSAISNIVLAAVLFVSFVYLIHHTIEMDLTLACILLAFAAFIGCILYFSTKFSIATGVKSFKRK